MNRQRGFSLIELMIAVGIIGILAAVAVPGYQNYVLKGKLAEARSNLAGMRVKLEQYYQDRRTYTGACALGTAAPLPTDGKYFTYACDLSVPDAYVVTATGVTAEGTGGFAFTINQANVRATTAVASGWSTSASCWVRSNGGAC